MRKQQAGRQQVPHTPDHHPDPRQEKAARLFRAYGGRGRYPTPIEHDPKQLEERLRQASRVAEEQAEEKRRLRRDRWWALLILLGVALIVWVEWTGAGRVGPMESPWPPPPGTRRVR